jgi:uncharacterized membrane protein
MKGKFVGLIMLFLVSMLAINLVSALPNIDEVKIDGEVAPASLEVERGDEIDIKVRLTATTDEEDIEVEAEILGYEYGDHEPIFDKAHIFDLDANDTTYKTLSLDLPNKMDKDYYDLRVRVGSRTGPTQEIMSRIHLKGVRHEITIKDVVFSPSHEVVGGRALLSTVRVKNIGDKDEEGIKVTVAIPALGLKASDYIDELEADESTTSEELYIRIPTCAEAGIYDVIVTVEFDEGYDSVSMEKSIVIVESEVCDTGDGADDDAEGKTIVTVPETQDVVKGTSGVVYPITITNLAKSSKTYTITVSGVEAFGSYRIDPSNVMVVKGEDAETVYVYVSANDDAAAGEKAFVVNVATDAESKDIALSADVIESSSTTSWSTARKALEIGLIVLVVILIIIGLVIGFSKLKGNEDESDEEPADQTYY